MVSKLLTIFVFGRRFLLNYKRHPNVRPCPVMSYRRVLQHLEKRQNNRFLIIIQRLNAVIPS
jgi:hypothetical protein